MLGKRRYRTVKFSRREVLTKGLPRDFWRDLYHQSMTVNWPIFVLGVAAVFLFVNALFAALFAFGKEPIANAPPGSLAHLFFFSVETLATVGYGDMHPQTIYGHVVASVEMFSGLIFAAVITGLIFARFSKPRARLVFADVATISPHDGRNTLSIRVANARLNLIANARAKLWMIRNVVTAEGKPFRRFHKLDLVSDESPVFTLSWSIFHVIDEKSPLWQLGAEDLETSEASFVLTIQGRDESFAQEVQGRQTYGWDDLRWNSAYADIMETGTPDRLIINHDVFHVTRSISDT